MTAAVVLPRLRQQSLKYWLKMTQTKVPVEGAPGDSKDHTAPVVNNQDTSKDDEATNIPEDKNLIATQAPTNLHNLYNLNDNNSKINHQTNSDSILKKETRRRGET